MSDPCKGRGENASCDSSATFTLARAGVKMQVVIFLLHSVSCKGRGENASCDISATCRILQRSG